MCERHPCDFNGDGVIDAADYTVWRDTFGQTVAHGSGADANGDGLVNESDYALWTTSYGAVFGIGTGPGAAASVPGQAVPEPSSLTLVALCLLSLCQSRACRPQKCNNQWVHETGLR